VKYIEGNHYTMLAEEQLPKIINGIFLEWNEISYTKKDMSIGNNGLLDLS
jgi:hypothetical protein